MKPVDLTAHHMEKTTTRRKNLKQKLRLNIVGIMVVFLAVITFFAIRKMDSIPYHHFTTYIAMCFGTWAASMVISELVLVVGCFILYLLRDRK